MDGVERYMFRRPLNIDCESSLWNLGRPLDRCGTGPTPPPPCSQVPVEFRTPVMSREALTEIQYGPLGQHNGLDTNTVIIDDPCALSGENTRYTRKYGGDTGR